MEESPFLPLPKGLLISQVQASDTQLTVVIASTGASASCPGCGAPSEHLHSHYRRTVNDVACGGRQVLLQLHVRKFRCLTLTCPRRIFTERLPELVQPWARVTKRLLEELKALGLATSAQVSERLAPRLGMKVKAPTLLHYLRTIPPPADAPVRVLGLDDFAIRRGDSYGTIFVNLETGKPLDLVPDRTADAVLPWLKRHQEIEVVSRDRASAYADAVKRALPHATQVADRYHLVQNLREHLQNFLDHKRSALPSVTDDPLKAPAEPPAPHTRAPTPQVNQAPGEPTDLSCLTYAERKKSISRDKRSARYEEVMALHRAGMGQRAIARQLGLSRNTVRRYVCSPGVPQRAEGSGRRPKEKTKLGPYLPYLRQRWDAGIHNNSQLFAQIRARGYTGCQSGLRRLLSEWRTELPPTRRQGQPRKPRLACLRASPRLSSRQAAFLMISAPEKRTQVQQRYVEQMCQNQEELHRAYLLSQEFVKCLKERKAQFLDDWLARARASHIGELKSFANGIRRDYAAVRAAFSLPWSNGVVEGQVNRLKLIKRQMFGRAHLDLLRVKVLQAV